MPSRSTKWLVAVLVLSIGLTVQASAEPTAAIAAEPLAWSTPQTIGEPETLVAVSCPSASLCVVGDNEGHMLTSVNPTAGASTWSKTESVDPFGVNDMSCVVGLCVGADGNGSVVTATDPTKGTDAWQLAHVDGTISGFNAVSCASTALCVGVDYGTGDVVTSTDPTGGAAAWTTTNVDEENPLIAVTCPTTSLCLAGDNAGHIVTSTDPAGGAATWHGAHIDGSSIVTGIACPTTTFCVAVDSDGNVLTSSNPTGGASAWSSPVQIDTNSFGLSDLSCPTTTLCAAVDEWGNVLTSTDPAGGAGAWHLTNVEGGNDFDKSLNSVSCPTVALCVVTDIQGHVLIGTPPVDEPPVDVVPPPPHDEPKARIENPPPVTGGIDSPPHPSPAPITTAQLVALLKQQLTPHGKAASLRSLLKHGGLIMPFAAPEAGTLSVSWYLVPKGATLAKHAKPVLVASGKLTVAATTPGQLTLKLTAAGKRQLKHVKRVKLTVKGTFAASRGGSTSTTAEVTTRR